MKKLLVVSAIAALGLTSVALAGSLPEDMPASPAAVSSSDMGVYVGIEGGIGTSNWIHDLGTKASSGSEYGLTGRAFLGADLNRYFALEFGCTYFAKKVEFVNLGNKLKNTMAFDLMGKIKAPVIESFDVYAKIGANYLMSKFDKDGTGNYATFKSKNSINVAFGAGFDYYITPNIIANVEWLRFNGCSKLEVDNYQPNSDAFMAGLRYRFDI